MKLKKRETNIFTKLRSLLCFGCAALAFSTELSAMSFGSSILLFLETSAYSLTHRRMTTVSAGLSNLDYPIQNQDAPKILRFGNSKLYEKSLPFNLPEEMSLVHEVLEQMRQATKGMGNVGLAAPQIGILRQLVMLEIPATHPRYKTDGIAQPMRIMINPVWKALSDDKNVEWEGCLSVPGMMGMVQRYTHIEYSYFDLGGNLQSVEAYNFHARAVQHEIDHLNGVLFPLLVENRCTLGFTEEIMHSSEFKKSRGLV